MSTTGPALALCMLLLGSCSTGDDATGRSGTATRSSISGSARALVEATVDKSGLTPLCSAEEAAADFERIVGDEAALEKRTVADVVVSAYISRDCDPCYAIQALGYGMYAQLKLTSDSAALAELIRASLDRPVADQILGGSAGVLVAGPMRDQWRRECADWMRDFFQARMSAH